MSPLLLALISSVDALEPAGEPLTPPEMLPCHEAVLKLAREEYPALTCSLLVMYPGFRSVVCNADPKVTAVGEESKVPFIGLTTGLQVTDDLRSWMASMELWKVTPAHARGITSGPPMCTAGGGRWWRSI